MTHKTLVDLLEYNRNADRAVTYIEGESAERRVSFGEMYARALGILYHLQAMGAQRGDSVRRLGRRRERRARQIADVFVAIELNPCPALALVVDRHALAMERLGLKRRVMRRRATQGRDGFDHAPPPALDEARRFDLAAYRVMPRWPATAGTSAA